MAVNKRLLQGAAAAGELVPSEHFGVVLYEGDGSTSHSINGGKFGAGAYFNGSSSKITTSAKPINNNTSISISFWAKNISVSDYATLIGEGGNSTVAGYKVFIKNTNDGNMALVRSAGGGSYIIPDSYFYDFGTCLLYTSPSPRD